MTASLQTLDVRPILLAGVEPFQEIMQAVAQLDSGQGLRLLANFKPAPLFSVMQKKGFAHCESELEGGDWEVIFTPVTAAAAQPAPPSGTGHTAQAEAADAWPAPSRTLDNRGMMPPEPMVITLETIEAMAAGEVLEGWYDRDPLLLYPELETRGHLARCEKRGAGDYRVLIRRGAGQGRAS
jgi:uncharacterized protein (DUF2249 family)